MRGFKAHSSRTAVAGLLLATAACAPRLGPLRGAPVPARLPATSLGTTHRRIVFTWELDEANLVARGDGAARLAPPDSVRLDFFLANGAGSGAVVLIGGDVRLPRTLPDSGLIPPPALLWAALGRFAVPATRDTVARLDGSILEADLGRPVRWRVTFDGGALRRLERVDGGRVREWVTRSADGRVRYRDESDRRTLDLVITTSADTGPFDASLWTFP